MTPQDALTVMMALGGTFLLLLGGFVIILGGPKWGVQIASAILRFAVAVLLIFAAFLWLLHALLH